MFPALAGSKKIGVTTSGTAETRLLALTLAAERQRRYLKEGVEARVARVRRSIRAPIGRRVDESNAYVQLFRSPVGDTAAAAQLLRDFNPRRNGIDLVGIVPEFARALAKYQKVLSVMEREDREFAAQRHARGA